MPGPLRKGRALLQRVVSTRPSYLQHAGSSDCLQTVVSESSRPAESHLAQPASFLRLLWHPSWAAAAGDAEIEALQTRRASGSSASTSSVYSSLPAAGTQYSRRHFSSSRDPSSAEGLVEEIKPSVKGRLSRLPAAKQHRQNSPRRGVRPRDAARSASSPDRAGEDDASASSEAYEGKRHARVAHSTAAVGQSGRGASRGRHREARAEAAKSRRTQQLEAMAAEILRDGEAKNTQPAAPPKQTSAMQLRFPGYELQHVPTNPASHILHHSGEGRM